MQLTLTDIAAAVQLIDIVTTRGAFRGEELSQIGALRDKYAAFISAAKEAQDAAEVEAAGQEQLLVDTEASAQ